MKNIQILSLLLVILGGFSCVTSKSLNNEKAMEAWLSNATLPITVQFQSDEVRCKPSLHCYTLIDNAGRVHYAKNVRHLLPRVIPPDSTVLHPRWWERLLGPGY